jgi:CheY-like chemotaxis protein
LSQKEDQEKAMKLGADGFIVKSAYTPSALVKEVGRLISESQESEKNIGREGGLAGEGDKAKNGKKKKVLLIEDEKIFAEMFGEKIKQDGFDLTVAENGAWGMKEALSGEYDLFIIDMVMPAMTGDEIVSRLKLEEKTKNKPIIVLSASVDELVEKKMRQAGISEFFTKTQTIPSELSKKVAELLEDTH